MDTTATAAPNIDAVGRGDGTSSTTSLRGGETGGDGTSGHATGGDGPATRGSGNCGGRLCVEASASKRLFCFIYKEAPSYSHCLLRREGAPKGRSTVLTTVAGSWGKPVPRGHSLVIGEGHPEGWSTERFILLLLYRIMGVTTYQR
jgi:hypothetical protein